MLSWWICPNSKMDFPAILITQLLTNSYLGFTRFYKHFICLLIVLRNCISCLVLYNHQSEHRALPWPQRSCYHFMIIPHHLPPSPRLTSGNLWPVLYNLVTVRIVHKWDYTVCYILWLVFFSPLIIMPLRSIPGSALCPLHVFLSITSPSDFLWSYAFKINSIMMTP